MYLDICFHVSFPSLLEYGFQRFRNEHRTAGTDGVNNDNENGRYTLIRRLLSNDHNKFERF